MKNTIINGDCIDILTDTPPSSVDMIFADPPYNLQLGGDLSRPDGSKVEGVNDSWDKYNDHLEYDGFTVQWLLSCKRVLKPNGTIWVSGSYHNIFRVGVAMMGLGYWVLNDITWHKSNPMPNFRGTRFTNATETIIWASRDKDSSYTFNYQLMKAMNGGKQMTSVWNIPICSGGERLRDEEGNKVHSTQKPEKLLERIVLSSTNEGDLVLDPFFGSGTTGAVCKKHGRNWIGIEKEDRYIGPAMERIEKVIPVVGSVTVNGKATQSVMELG